MDASALTVALADDGPDGARARERLRADPSQHAPHLIDIEVLSALRRLATSGHLERARAAAALRGLQRLPIERYPDSALAPRIWELRGNLTPYDAAYIALAEAIGCPLLTGDRKLARAPSLRCSVEVLA